MVLWHGRRPLWARTASQWTHGGSCPTALSLHKQPLYAHERAEPWANSEALPANYLALRLLPGSPGPAGPADCAPDVRWPGSTSQRGWYLVDPSGSHLVHKTQTSAGVLVGLRQTPEWRGMETGERRELGVGKTGAGFPGEALSSQSPDQRPQRRERQKRR